MSLRAGAPYLLGWLLLALAIYSPWVSVPFPVVDYSEFLNRLRAGDSFWQSFVNVTEFYRSHGRSSYLANLQLAITWRLAGEHPVLWNVMTFAFMAMAITAAWTLFLKLGNSQAAAGLAALLMVVAMPAVHAWLRPISEPLALIILCSALIVALTYQQTRRWTRQAVLLLGLFLCLGLAKDLLTPLVAVPLAVACCWDDGFRKPAATPRNLVVTAGAAGVVLLLGILIVTSVARAAPDAYARSYSTDSISVGGFIHKLWINFLPYTRGYDPRPIGAGRVIANALFVGIIVMAIVVAARDAMAWRRMRRALAGALALGILGALIYAPLRWFTPFYALPFFLGSALLFARALSTLDEARPLTRRLARGAAILVVLIGAAAAFNIARRETAFRRIHGQLTEAMIGTKPLDSVIVTTATTDARQQADEAGFIRHHALVRGHDAPPTRAVPCASAARVRTGGVMLVNYPDLCGKLPYPATRLAQPYLVLTPWPLRRYLRLEFAIFGVSASPNMTER